MNRFKQIPPEQLQGNPFQMIGKDWALVIAAKESSVNTMTVSWGGVGVLWNKPVAYIFVRPQRYTYEFTEYSDYFSLAFFDDSYKDALKYCGTISGRDEDKIAHCGFHTQFEGEIPYFAEATAVLLCKKVYAQDLGAEFALDEVVTTQYPNNDYHRMYIGQILSVLVRE